MLNTINPDHSTTVSDETAFAEDATGEEAKLYRKETTQKVGLTDRKMLGKGHGGKIYTRNTDPCKEISKYFNYLHTTMLFFYAGDSLVMNA